MPIHRPGENFRYNRMLTMKTKKKRSVVVVLSLTAMVDMFTVLVIFLLQNYNTVLYIPPEVNLPKAETTKDLKPAVVVTISDKDLMLDKKVIMTYDQLKGQEDWMIQPLFLGLLEALKRSKFDYEKNYDRKLRNAVNSKPNQNDDDPFAWNKVTIQADKGIDFLSVKKIMYTVTEAGASEINFAVAKEKAQK